MNASLHQLWNTKKAMSGRYSCLFTLLSLGTLIGVADCLSHGDHAQGLSSRKLFECPGMQLSKCFQKTTGDLFSGAEQCQLENNNACIALDCESKGLTWTENNEWSHCAGSWWGLPHEATQGHCCAAETQVCGELGCKKCAKEVYSTEVQKGEAKITNKTPLAEHVDNSWIENIGNTSYPGILLPASFNISTGMPEAHVAIPRGELAFIFAWDSDLKNRNGIQGFFIMGILVKNYVDQVMSASQGNGDLPKLSTFYQQNENFMNAVLFPRVPSHLKDRTPAKLLSQGIFSIQGSNGVWKSDKYASELLSYSLISMFFEKTSDGLYEVDFTGSSQGASTPVNDPITNTHDMKRRIVDLAPENVLRCKAYLSTESESDVKTPMLTKIEVYQNGKKSFDADPSSSGLHWDISKQVLHSMGAFVIENVHTAAHLFSHTIVAASARSLPTESLFNGLMDPQSTAVEIAMLEQTQALHADYNAMFSKNKPHCPTYSTADAPDPMFVNFRKIEELDADACLTDGTLGSVWACEIRDVTTINARMVQYFLSAESEMEILGMNSGNADAQEEWWWAGGAHEFIEPIKKFALAAGQAVVADAQAHADATISGKNYLQDFEEQLRHVGVMTDVGGGDSAGGDSAGGDSVKSNPDVKTAAGVAHVYSRAMFFQSVVHGSMYSTREYMTSICLPETKFLLNYVNEELDISDALDKAVQEHDAQAGIPLVLRIRALFGILYGTAAGIEGAPELSDGPYYNTQDWVEADSAISEFRSNIAAARKSVSSRFKAPDHLLTPAQFKPSYYFPKDEPKPIGYGLTHTTYV